MNARRRILVLLATHDGERWIDDQARSISDQRDVALRVAVSDDASADRTRGLLGGIGRRDGRWGLLAGQGPFGGATPNFLRLIRDADLGDADYVALADQDDVWHADKLARAIDALAATACDGYTASVLSLYPGGRQALLDKAQPQRRYDHLFESPGPGCTFVLRRALFERLRAFVVASGANLDELAHDWLIYAFARCTGHGWHIDPQPAMLYRQHERNVVGANAGWSAARTRIARVRSGWYRSQIERLCNALQRAERLDSSTIESVERWLGQRPTLGARLRFGYQVARHARRRARDRWMLLAFVISGLFWGAARR